MGRYAQRKIAGGGPKTTGTNQLQIISKTNSPDGLLTTYTFSGPVDAGDFTPGDFQTTPGALNADVINQGAANSLEVSWFSDIRNEIFVSLTTTAPNVLSPQVLAT